MGYFWTQTVDSFRNGEVLVFGPTPLLLAWLVQLVTASFTLFTTVAVDLDLLLRKYSHSIL